MIRNKTDTNKQLIYRNLPVMVVLFCLGIVSSCLSDDISRNPDQTLTFSQDTLVFDTVFTTRGSATRSFRIVNTENDVLEISKIYLENGESSRFRVNIDGISGDNQENIRVPAQDSIWVFAEVTIDPDMPLSVSPFIIEERLIMEINDNEEAIILQAFGQNANYITNEDFKGQIGVISCDNGELNWGDPKPYVIFGVVVIDSCTLSLPPGTRIHIHGGVVRLIDGIRGDGFLIFGPEGRLSSNGNFSDPVIIEGDRLEPSFDDISGQYGGIIFTPGSRGNLLRHTRIQNSTNALRLDSTSSVSLEYCEIKNASGAGILSIHADLSIDNSLIYDCGLSSVQIVYGGNTEIRHSTLASYGNTDPSLALSNFIVRDPVQNIIDVNPLSARVANCILIGNSDDELRLSDATEDDDFNLMFSHTLIKVDRLIEAESRFENLLTEICPTCINATNTDPIFRNRSESFRLDTLSIADNLGEFISELNTDFDQNTRSEGDTDAGCYQFIPEM